MAGAGGDVGGNVAGATAWVLDEGVSSGEDPREPVVFSRHALA